MRQCKDCEHFRRDPSGRIAFACDPFGTILEPECLAKWQLIRMDQLVQSYQATLSFYRRLAPMQEKMFRVLQREIEDIDEADRWKLDQQDDPDAPPADDWDRP